MIRAATLFFVSASLLCLEPACENGCEDATNAMVKSIAELCGKDEYSATPFCTCCVPAGYYAIDDTCTCQRLVLDADFCFYQDGKDGHPQVRAALDYASSVCAERKATVPASSKTLPTSCQLTSSVGAAGSAGTSANSPEPQAGAGGSG